MWKHVGPRSRFHSPPVRCRPFLAHKAHRSSTTLAPSFLPSAAALQLTTLYRTSLSTSKRSYAAGYAQSIADVLDTVQLRLHQRSSNTASKAEAEREELNWLVHYLRARLEAIKTDSEDDDDKEESEDEEEPAEPAPSSSAASAAAAAAAAADSASSSHQIPRAGAATREQSSPAPVAPLCTRGRETTSSGSARGSRSSAATRSGSHAKSRGSLDSLDSRTVAAAALARPTADMSASLSYATGTSTPRAVHGPIAGVVRGRRTRMQSGQTSTSSPPAGRGTPPRVLRASSSDEDETSAAVTPTSRVGAAAAVRRTLTASTVAPTTIAGVGTVPPGSTTAAASAAATRLGKRMSGGRERLSNAEMFGRTLQAKRRRHAGERHDEDRQHTQSHPHSHSQSPTPPPGARREA